MKGGVDFQQDQTQVLVVTFEWDPAKEAANLRKHGVDFSTVTSVFRDPRRLILSNPEHSGTEERLYAIGYDGRGVLAVRFTMRGETIRVIGAGYWRKQREVYENQ